MIFIKKTIILLLIGLIISCSSNHDEHQITQEFIKSATNEIGTIGTINVEGIEKFTINTRVPGTMDSLIVGIVDEFPLVLNKLGNEVIFSGNYIKGENTPLPTLGGQTIYDLTLSSVESKKTFEIKGKFRHTISGCNNTNNPEINCVEFIHFYNETKADILIGGSDIVNLANYEVIDDRIDIEITDGLKINISFIIQDEMTLRRIESDDIWNKVE
tara:strand:+ start:151 stop:795 length:645 start_codon:yes stop_codon:yes gene_type:complete